jgi:hypothetical protein
MTLRAASVLGDLIRDSTFCTDPASQLTDQLVSELDGEAAALGPSALSIKFTVLREMFSKARQAIPRPYVDAMPLKLFESLVSHSGGIDTVADALESWARLCGDLLVLCDVEDIKACCDVVFGGDADDAQWPMETRVCIWRQIVQTWQQDNDASWEGAVVILTIPFASVFFLANSMCLVY